MKKKAIAIELFLYISNSFHHTNLLNVNFERPLVFDALEIVWYSNSPLIFHSNSVETYIWLPPED